MSKKGLQFDLWVERFVITCIIASMCGCAYVCFGDYVITKPQPLARSLTDEQLDVVLTKTPANANVTLPAHLVASKKADIQANAMLEQLQAIIADTRTNIIECAELSDVEIALLYLQQMTKKANEINIGGTNTIEKIIGAGMRDDIKTSQNIE